MDSEEPQTEQIPVQLPQTPQIEEVIPRKQTKKIILAVAVVAVVVTATALYVWPGILKSDNKKTSTQQASSVNITDAKEATIDEFYIASAYNKYVKFYSASKDTVDEVKIATNLDIVTADISMNNSIQVTKSTRRIFFLAGEFEGQGEGGEFTTHEIFELVDGKPKQLFKLLKPERITDWVIDESGSTIIVKTTTLSTEKSDNGYDVRKIDVATGKVDKIAKPSSSSTDNNTKLRVNSVDKVVNYFTSKGSKTVLYTINYQTNNTTSKEFLATCLANNAFCSPEYPQFLSPDHKLLAWGFMQNDRFGVEIIQLATGNKLASYSLDTNLVQIGSVFWAADSSKILFDVPPYSGAGQEQVGREERLMQLSIASNKTEKLFASASPGISDIEKYNSAAVSATGYSNSGKFALFRNKNKYQLFELDTKKVTKSFDGPGSDSGTFVEWLR